MRHLFIFLGLFLLSVPAMAAMTQSDQAALNRAEDYLQGLKNLQADFTQTFTDYEGQQTYLTGTFSLQRPGKMRFSFNEIDDFIVADGFLLYFYDSDEGTQTNAPIGQTLADFVLRENISFRDPSIQVTDVRRSNGYLSILMTHAEDPDLGSFQMIFSEVPFRLHKWQVVDSAGTVVDTKFENLRSDISFPRGFFAYADPNPERGLYND